MKLIAVFLVFISFVTSQEIKINNISAFELKEIISKQHIIQLVDVRTSREFELGHIKNAKNIDYYSMKDNKSIKQLDKQQPIYLYCRSGVRSLKASKIFEKLGFSKIYNIKGGYLAWEKIK